MKTKTIAGTGILCAVSIVLYIVGALLAPITGVSINLSLIPIVLAGAFYGPISAAIVGLVNGVSIMIDPSTILFFNESLVGTIIICTFKATLGGVACAFLFKALRKKNEDLAIILSSVLMPIVNTGLFLLGAAIFYKPDFMAKLLTMLLLFNFLIELATTIVLSFSIKRVVKYQLKRQEDKK